MSETTFTPTPEEVKAATIRFEAALHGPLAVALGKPLMRAEPPNRAAKIKAPAKAKALRERAPRRK
jgi:hypothetical protein